MLCLLLMYPHALCIIFMQEDAITQIHTEVSASLTDIASTGLVVPPMIEDVLRQIHTTTGSAMAAVYADRRLRVHTDIPPSFGSQDTRPPPDAPPAPRGRGLRRA